MSFQLRVVAFSLFLFLYGIRCRLLVVCSSVSLIYSTLQLEKVIVGLRRG